MSFVREVVRKSNSKYKILRLNGKSNCEISMSAFVDHASDIEERVKIEKNTRVFLSSIGKESVIGYNTLIGNCQLRGNNRILRNTELHSSDIGFGTYIGFGTKFINTKIGKFTSVAPNVRIIVGNHPTKKFVSTYPAFYREEFDKEMLIHFKNNNNFDELSYADKEKKYFCQIGNDVWIGSEVRLLNGINVGDGAVIAAGALVTKNVPPYAVVGGVPAKIIRYRFTPEQIESLLRIKWWNKDIEWISDRANQFGDIENFLLTVGDEEDQ